MPSGRFAARVLRHASSLKLAVLVIAALACAQMVGTILESRYDTATAKYWVYHAFWFRALLGLFAINIFAVMVSRWPWKKRHIPFLLAHIGILMLLFGGVLTDRFGVDGILRLSEGGANAQVDLDDYVIAAGAPGSIRALPLKFVPEASLFDPIEIEDLGVKVTQFLPHAEPNFQFLAAEGKHESEKSAPAIQLRLKGGPLQVSQDLWLWSGDGAWAQIQTGPAEFLIYPQIESFPKTQRPGAGLEIVTKGDAFAYRVRSSKGMGKAIWIKGAKAQGTVIQTPWMGMKIEVLQWIPHAVNASHYGPSRITHGEGAPPPAIEVQVGGEESGRKVWLGLGERVNVRDGGIDFQVGFFQRRIVLPFSLFLDRFQIETYQGTMDPMSYGSDVRVVGEDVPFENVQIRMNEPLKWGGYTFYQASYVPAMPRPTVSILSVNKDPGRLFKYLGSILLVLGSILLFVSKYRKQKRK